MIHNLETLFLFGTHICQFYSCCIFYWFNLYPVNVFPLRSLVMSFMFFHCTWLAATAVPGITSPVDQGSRIGGIWLFYKIHGFGWLIR